MRIVDHRDSVKGALKHPDGMTVLLGDRRMVEAESPLYRRDSCERRMEVISAYLEVLEQMTAPLSLETDLPYPKEEIRRAIFHELVEDPQSELRHQLEIAYIQLESFIPTEEYMVIKEFKNASSLAQELADMGDPSSIVLSARMMKNVRGESAVRIQERISERMGLRRSELERIGCSICCRSFPEV